MRLFLAITVPDEVKARLTAAVLRLKPLAIDVKWYTKEQFHLTLAYLGEVSPAILPHVTGAAERVCKALPPFTCRAAGFGYFGTKRNPHSIWAGIDPSPELLALQDLLWKELKKFGYENAEDEFLPHITLGRCRESARNHPVIEATEADEDSDFGEWEVARVTRFESRLTPRGALYRSLGYTELTGGA